mgnify:CR=1 FL=1
MCNLVGRFKRNSQKSFEENFARHSKEICKRGKNKINFEKSLKIK